MTGHRRLLEYALSAWNTVCLFCLPGRLSVYVMAPMGAVAVIPGIIEAETCTMMFDFSETSSAIRNFRNAAAVIYKEN